ncbi:hypothetical protein MKZ38_002374 [Zalerion maritima]|uniref:Protamine P1 n=1 Tax=Zalerion maritima TaxID=339359 RepID=A0AAD5WVE7_9PEZI|nr:hypothetical protein MKZ38_002374 [Zalerion maritima]
MAENEGFYDWSWRQSRLLGDEPLYSEAPRGAADELGDTNDDGLTEEELVQRRRRCEAHGQRYLQGKSIFLLSIVLRKGPFEASNGWKNPWKKTIARPQSDIQAPDSDITVDAIPRATFRDNRLIPETQLLPETQQPSEVPILEIPDLPDSPAPIVGADESAVNSELAPSETESSRVENWVDSVPAVRLEREEFWMPALTAPRKTPANKKTTKDGGRWLRRKGRRVFTDNSEAPSTPSAGRQRVPSRKNDAPESSVATKMPRTPIHAKKKVVSLRQGPGQKGVVTASRRLAGMSPETVEEEVPTGQDKQPDQPEDPKPIPLPETEKAMEVMPFETQADESFIFHRRREPWVPQIAPPASIPAPSAPHKSSSISTLSPAPSHLDSHIDFMSESRQESVRDDGKSSVDDDVESQTPSSSHGGTDTFGPTPRKLAALESTVEDPEAPSDSRDPKASPETQDHPKNHASTEEGARVWNDTTIVATQHEGAFSGHEDKNSSAPNRYCQLKGQPLAQSSPTVANAAMEPETVKKMSSEAEKGPASSQKQPARPGFMETVLRRPSYPTSPAQSSAPPAEPEKEVEVAKEPIPKPRIESSTPTRHNPDHSVNSGTDDGSIMNNYHRSLNTPTMPITSPPLDTLRPRSQPCSMSAPPTQSQNSDVDEEEIVIPMSRGQWVFNSSAGTSPAKSFRSSPMKTPSQSLDMESQESVLRISQSTQSPWTRKIPPVLSHPFQRSRQAPSPAASALIIEGTPTSQSPWVRSTQAPQISTGPPSSPPHGPPNPSPPRVATQEQSPWSNSPSLLKRRRTDLTAELTAQTSQASPLSELCNNAVPHLDNDMGITLRPFSSLISSPPKRRRLDMPGASSNSGLPSTQNLLAATTENPWENSHIASMGKGGGGGMKSFPLAPNPKPKKTVNWAPLPTSSSDDKSQATPKGRRSRGRSLSRAASPPPSKYFVYKPGGKERMAYEKHFSMMANKTISKKGDSNQDKSGRGLKPKSALKKQLLPSDSQQGMESPNVEGMALRFIDADADSNARTSSISQMIAASRMDIDGNFDESRGHDDSEIGFVLSLKSIWGAETQGISQNDDVNEVLHNLDDFVGGYKLDEEMEKAANGEMDGIFAMVD